MTTFTQSLAALRRTLADLGTGFEHLVRIRFSAPWRAPERCGR